MARPDARHHIGGTAGSRECPLTGLDPASGVKVDRSVLGVKIDGSIASKSPSGQSGLDSADIVYDEPVEGGFGRFFALYQCGNPTKVGPIREARPEDPSLLAQYGWASWPAPDPSRRPAAGHADGGARQRRQRAARHGLLTGQRRPPGAVQPVRRPCEAPSLQARNVGQSLFSSHRSSASPRPWSLHSKR